MLHNDLYTYLTTTTAISDLFPGGIYHLSMPQEITTYPALSFQMVTHTEFADDMEAPNDAKIDQFSYQFDIVADKSAVCINAADSFVQIFRNFRGTMTGTRVQWVNLQNVTHLEERRGDKLRRRVSVDFTIFVDVT